MTDDERPSSAVGHPSFRKQKRRPCHNTKRHGAPGPRGKSRAHLYGAPLGINIS